jgi:hypothetical protein
MMRREEGVDGGPTSGEIKYALQQAILRHYPNPEREGCLDSATIQAVAQQRLPHEDLRWEHISHCSPCYREFLDCRKQFREKQARADQLRRRMRFALLVTIVVIGLSAMMMLKIR